MLGAVPRDDDPEREVAEPLGADFHIGLPASEDGRVADLVPPPIDLAAAVAAADTSSIGFRTLIRCPVDGYEPRTREWRGAEIPAAGGTGNARSVARVHSALACGGTVDGVRLLSSVGVERVLEEQARGTDLVLGFPLVLGLGFGIVSESTPLSPNKRAFFWGGWSGSIALVDLESRMSAAYVMNHMAGALGGDLRGALVVIAAAQAAASLASPR